MSPSIVQYSLIVLVFYSNTIALPTKTTSVVIEVKGDCATIGQKIAEEHGYRFVRQIFDGFCEIEEDPLSSHYHRRRRAIELGTDPLDSLRTHENVSWAESQVPKKRKKREFEFNDPLWHSMWYLIRHSQLPSLPDLNVTGAWNLGYTGRGRVVTFLDDGLEFDHPDLQENYDKEASTDINDNDDDPTPRYEATNENKHGTRCAGEVAAKINNNICGVGIAYHARVGGIRMLDGDVTDSVEARSLSHRPDHIDIYSASWGPDDNGLVVDGPGRLAKKAFENGALYGRNGKGSIFVWASGNGGRQFDSCACDGYITSIYTIAISATTEHGDKPWYLEECSATLASAYSSGQSNSGERDILTTDLNHACTNHHTGTSAAAPLAAAIYALILEANPDLTWRDVMYITVLGSRSHAIPSNTNVVRNAAGFNVSSRFGFGLMDAGLMTWYATGWKNVPPMCTCESATSRPKQLIPSQSSQTFTLNLIECKNPQDSKHEVNYIEQVQVFVSLATDRRGEIEIYLYSPSRTRTQLLPRRERDQNSKGFDDWPFLTVQLWGEVPHGTWQLEIRTTGGGTATLLAWRLVVHGTREYPISVRSTSVRQPVEIDRSICHVECRLDQPCGTLDTNCTACRHYKQMLSNGIFRCVGICPVGTYATENEKLCLPCHSQCESCRNATDSSCISCKSDFFLVHDAMKCTETCPEQYYTDRHLRKCIRCKPNCASCDTSSHICSSCPDGYALKGKDCLKSNESCKKNEYFNFQTNNCRECHARCSTCSGPQADQCRSCDQTGNYPYLQMHSCVASCSSGFYLSAEMNRCLPCHETCLNCTSWSELACTSCKLGYVLLSDSHRCEQHTGKPYYIDVNTGETHTCHSSCAFCKGPQPNDCVACQWNVDVLLDDGHCVSQCPLSTYRAERKTPEFQTQICLPCSDGCSTCSDGEKCETCDQSSGYRLVDSVCVAVCPRGSFRLKSQCEPCPSSCSTCLNETFCLSCSNDFVLFNNQCVKSCPNSYFLQNRQCSPCHPSCKTCQGASENDCQSCSKGFQMNGKGRKCLSLCPNGNYYDFDQEECKICTDNCLECYAPGTDCRQCVYPYALNLMTHRCVSCCASNTTNKDCCQCSPSWDGFCLHPLVSISSTIKITWFVESIERLNNGFNHLGQPYQTALTVIIITILLVFVLFLLMCGIRQICGSRLSSTSAHNDVEYVMLENVDEDDENPRQTGQSKSPRIGNQQ